MATVVLDRAQRTALHNELSYQVVPYGDWGDCFGRRDRNELMLMFEQMRNAVAIMDAIGWTEQPDTADRVHVSVDRRLADWASRIADELAIALPEAATPATFDTDLDALSALRMIGKAAP